MVSKKKITRTHNVQSRKTAGTAAHASKSRPVRNPKAPSKKATPKLAARAKALASTLQELPEELPLNEAEELGLDETPEVVILLEEAEAVENGADLPEALAQAELIQADEDLLE